MTTITQLADAAEAAVSSVRQYLSAKHRFEYGDITIEEIDELERVCAKRTTDLTRMIDEVRKASASECNKVDGWGLKGYMADRPESDEKHNRLIEAGDSMEDEIVRLKTILADLGARGTMGNQSMEAWAKAKAKQ